MLPDSIHNCWGKNKAYPWGCSNIILVAFPPVIKESKALATLPVRPFLDQCTKSDSCYCSQKCFSLQNGCSCKSFWYKKVLIHLCNTCQELKNILFYCGLKKKKNSKKITQSQANRNSGICKKHYLIRTSPHNNYLQSTQVFLNIQYFR